MLKLVGIFNFRQSSVKYTLSKASQHINISFHWNSMNILYKISDGTNYVLVLGLHLHWGWLSHVWWPVDKETRQFCHQLSFVAMLSIATCHPIWRQTASGPCAWPWCSLCATTPDVVLDQLIVTARSIHKSPSLAWTNRWLLPACAHVDLWHDVISGFTSLLRWCNQRSFTCLTTYYNEDGTAAGCHQSDAISFLTWWRISFKLMVTNGQCTLLYITAYVCHIPPWHWTLAGISVRAVRPE